MSDLLLLSLGMTQGARIADAQFAEMAREAGASVDVVATRIGALDRFRRGYPVNDAIEALAARRALRAALRRGRPRAVVFSTTTAALLASRELELPYAVWLDSPARLNRPGLRNRPLHRLERRSLAGARLILTQSQEAIPTLPRGAAPAVVISPPIELPPPRTMRSDPLVVAYTPDPRAKDLELVVRAWREVTHRRAQLVITGIDPEVARAFLGRFEVGELPPRAELVGMLDQREFGRLLSRARVFMLSARWEDFGIAPLEALARGAVLAGAPGGGPFPALRIARTLGPSFVSRNREPAAVAAALDAALAADARELGGYQALARDRLRPYRERVIVKRLRDEVLPRLLP